MIKFAALAAAVAVSAFALPAAAGDLHVTTTANPVVRIPVAGKAADVLAFEIQQAASSVCTARSGAALTDCVEAAVRDANRQLKAIKRAHQSPEERIEVARADPTTVRISLKGKSPAQIELDIQVAARSVCKATTGQSTGMSFNNCFSSSVKDAKSRLAQITPNRQLASN